MPQHFANESNATSMWDSGADPYGKTAPQLLDEADLVSLQTQPMPVTELDTQPDLPPTPPTPPRRRRFPLVLAVLLATLVVVTGILGFALVGSVRHLRATAQTAIGFADSYVEATKTGDRDLLEQSARGMSNAVHDIRDELDSRTWTVVSRLPGVGSDVQNLRVIANELSTIADDALLPLAQSANTLNLSTLMSNSAVNVSSMKTLIEAVDQAAPVIQEASDAIEALPPARVGQIASIQDSVCQRVADANDALGKLHPFIPYLPELLGANGEEKYYLIIAENPAEIHASGGFVGTVGVLTALDGHLTMGPFHNLDKVMPYDYVSVGATDEEIAVFGSRIDTNHGDHNLTPDFSRAGRLFANAWELDQHQTVDGVIGVDPVFLQRMLQLTGPVDTSFGVSVDGSNAAATILMDCLFWWDPQTCDDFYREIADKAFARLLGRLGNVDTAEFMAVVDQSGEEGHCKAWLRDKDAELALMDAGLAWELPHDKTEPILGVYINDGSAAKLSYFLSVTTHMGQATARADGSRTYHVTTKLKNNFEEWRAQGNVPSYLVVSADGLYGRSDYDLFEEVALVAPDGGTISNVHTTYTNSTTPPPDVTWQKHTYQGLDTWRANLRLDAEESCTITYTVTTSSQAKKPLGLRTSPLVPANVREAASYGQQKDAPSH